MAPNRFCGIGGSVTVLEVIQRSVDFLAKKGVESPRLQLELLLAHTLKIPRLNLYLNFERELSNGEIEVLRQLVKRRGSREPLQHIIGTTSFCGLEMRVSPAVLVPRPETELLAERAWQYFNGLAPGEGVSVSALDFGTGSGCLAVALAMNAPAARLCALDISDAALEVAFQNATFHRVVDRIRFVRGDGFSALLGGGPFDLIVSNPPYIPSQEIETLQPEVREYDPRVALDGGEDGLAFYRTFASQAKNFLRPAGKLMLEFGDGQEEKLQPLFADQGWHVEAIEPDHTGHPRILVAKPNEL